MFCYFQIYLSSTLLLCIFCSKQLIKKGDENNEEITILFNHQTRQSLLSHASIIIFLAPKVIIDSR